MCWRDDWTEFAFAVRVSDAVAADMSLASPDDQKITFVELFVDLVLVVADEHRRGTHVR